jgi:hypothetical protein
MFNLDLRKTTVCWSTPFENGPAASTQADCLLGYRTDRPTRCELPPFTTPATV